MKRLRLWVWLAIAVLAATEQGYAQRKINERQALAPDASIRVVAQQGEVRIIGWEKDSIAVIGGVNETPSNKFALHVSPNGKGAKLGMWQEHAGEPAPASALRVYVPRNSSVWVKTTGASISASTTGMLELISVTGSIYVTNAPRTVTAETMAGDIHINAEPASVRAKTASGHITVAGTAAEVTAVTVSGNISVGLEKFARARFESVDGHIRYFGAIPAQALVEFVSHAGPITLSLPPKPSAEFSFNLYEAELSDDFGIRKRWLSTPTKAREMTFSLGDRPTARVHIRSFKGPVAIRQASANVK
jgi:hypothetical protein